MCGVCECVCVSACVCVSVCVCVCVITQHNYFYSEMVTLKDPLLRLKSIINIIGNM